MTFLVFLLPCLLSRLASHKKVNAPEKDVFFSLRSILIQSKVLDFAI